MKSENTFNWTKVELKLGEKPIDEQHLMAFNWTKVELKQCWLGYYSGNCSAFNWTKVELKPASVEKAWFVGESLLIELR